VWSGATEIGGEAAGGVDIDAMELQKRRVGGAPCLRNSWPTSSAIAGRSAKFDSNFKELPQVTVTH
jgi:hypothetical protein